ncbi:PREDICTED: LOW QUALITY PROTEIN: uncharacterized protein C20orf197 homolog [Colobus angolensis palliatus]|uniref:LOW QUALITY PROTEIN: uncharacterized protein C20orf197 homolog n=1 Tax=Colobus angolensis palliatus TaxID=336983 RepID=UPI0005F4B87C|nr:PREDICTED: LOW QUALITY PROTEIN: uncharacterized protein C20orf197 homolog [Colobus angolensis palliatus]
MIPRAHYGMDGHWCHRLWCRHCLLCQDVTWSSTPLPLKLYLPVIREQHEPTEPSPPCRKWESSPGTLVLRKHSLKRKFPRNAHRPPSRMFWKEAQLKEEISLKCAQTSFQNVSGATNKEVEVSRLLSTDSARGQICPLMGCTCSALVTSWKPQLLLAGARTLSTEGLSGQTAYLASGRLFRGWVLTVSLFQHSSCWQADGYEHSHRLKCQHFRQHRQYNDKLGISSNLSPPFNMLLNILLNRVHPTLSNGTRRSKGLKIEGLLQPRHLRHSRTVTMCIWVLKALKSSAPNKPLDRLDPMPCFQNLLARGTP